MTRVQELMQILEKFRADLGFSPPEMANLRYHDLSLKLGEFMDEIYKDALGDAAICLDYAAGVWEDDDPRGYERNRFWFAYSEGARVVSAWAIDPTRMDGILKAGTRRKEENRARRHDGT